MLILVKPVFREKKIFSYTHLQYHPHYIIHSQQQRCRKNAISSSYTSKHCVTSFRILTKKKCATWQYHTVPSYLFFFLSFFFLLQTILLDYICRFEWSVSFIWNITLNDVNIVHDIFEGDDVTLKRFFFIYIVLWTRIVALC